MAKFLLFTLYAPLASFGDVAVGERRAGFDRVGRSAVLGLVAAGLGIDRRDEAAHAELGASYDLALRVEAPGVLVQDYQTVQAPPARAGKRWGNRRSALAERKIETLLSLRDYRSDAISTVALIARHGANPAPEMLADRLRWPAFTLYVGRKACPLGLPLRPLAIDALNLSEAVAAFDAARPEPEARIRAELRCDRHEGRFFADSALSDRERDLLGPDFKLLRIERRRDQIASRVRWQFGLRDELVFERRNKGQPS